MEELSFLPYLRVLWATAQDAEWGSLWSMKIKLTRTFLLAAPLF